MEAAPLALGPSGTRLPPCALASGPSQGSWAGWGRGYGRRHQSQACTRTHTHTTSSGRSASWGWAGLGWAGG